MTHLTPADWDVIDLIGLGMSDKMIAAVRGTARQTVKNRVHGINVKLGAGNRIGILRAVGWLTIPENAVALGTPPSPKTHCLRGHPLSGENLRVERRHRHCRACQRLRQRVAA